MIYRTTRENIEKYFQSERINQSKIKLFSKGVDIYLGTELSPKEEKYFDEPKDHFKIGSAVDTILTEGQEEFDKQYYVTTLDKMPSDTMVSIVRQVYDTVSIRENFVPVLDNFTDEIVEACDGHNYQPRWGAEAKVNGVIREGTNYWLSLTEAGGRQVLTMEQNETIKYVSNSIMNFDYYKSIVSQTSPEEEQPHSRYDIFYQLPVYFNIGSIQCKALIDMVVVDHHSEIIYIYDFKTMWDTVENFPVQSRKRRYDIQGAFYYTGLKILHDGGELKKLLRDSYAGVEDDYSQGRNPLSHSFDSYKIDNPAFVVQSTTYKNNPVMFTMDSELLSMGRDGRRELYIPSVSTATDSNDESISTIKYPEIQGFATPLRKLHRLNRDSSLGIHKPIVNYDWYGEVTYDRD